MVLWYSIAYLWSGSEHTHWFLDLEGEVHYNMGFVDNATFKIAREILLQSQVNEQYFLVGSRLSYKKSCW